MGLFLFLLALALVTHKEKPPRVAGTDPLRAVIKTRKPTPPPDRREGVNTAALIAVGLLGAWAVSVDRGVRRVDAKKQTPPLPSSELPALATPPLPSPAPSPPSTPALALPPSVPDAEWEDA